VQFGVYWMHRKLHEVRLGYKFLHATHHVYNKENSLSPFAGLAFNPLDGARRPLSPVARRHASRCVTLIGLSLTSHLGLAPPSSLRHAERSFPGAVRPPPNHSREASRCGDTRMALTRVTGLVCKRVGSLLAGILQAIPYVWTLALVPMHFLTHEALLFATALWTTSIHDCVYGGGEPVMGAGYHLIHHTTYKHNYGHYLTFCDWAFGTLQRPPGYKGGKAQ